MESFKGGEGKEVELRGGDSLIEERLDDLQG